MSCLKETLILIICSYLKEKVIEIIIKKFKKTASAITSKTLKMLDVISEQLTHVINLCFTQGVIPADLKTAVVIPIQLSKVI